MCHRGEPLKPICHVSRGALGDVVDRRYLQAGAHRDGRLGELVGRLDDDVVMSGKCLGRGADRVITGAH